jgi:hypothetical protein
VYLRVYVNYHQDDWVDWLLTAEFSDNMKDSALIQVASFEANYGFIPRMSFDWSESDKRATTKPQQASREQAKNMAERMNDLWKEITESLRNA